MRMDAKMTVTFAIALSACNWGQQPADFAPAISAQGARVAVRVRGETTDRKGELYAVDADGVTVNADRLIRIRWAQLDAMDVLHLGDQFDVSFGERVSDRKRTQLAAVSRFPQGLAGDLLARVLTALSQASLVEVP